MSLPTNTPRLTKRQLQTLQRVDATGKDAGPGSSRVAMFKKLRVANLVTYERNAHLGMTAGRWVLTDEGRRVLGNHTPTAAELDALRELATTVRP